MNIIIVGAGPIGCYTAQLLKRKNRAFNVKLLEEHSQIGKPVHCSGLVSNGVFTELRIPVNQDVIINHIDGAEFFLNKDSFRINRKQVAVVVDRVKFDNWMASELDIDFNVKCVGIEENSKGYVVETDKGEYFGDVVIGADGANSSVRRMCGFKDAVELVCGVQFRIRHAHIDPQVVQVYFKKPFFAWVIPEGTGVVRAGIISRNPHHDLESFFEEIKIDGEVIEKFAGLIPIGTCVTQKKKILLVGDAACQVKPLTHGGIYYGMRCAEILADCIAEGKVNQYERRWRKRFGKEIQIGLKTRSFYQRLSNVNTQKIFQILKNNKEVLEEFGDFENHSKVFAALLRKPNLQSALGKILISILKDIHI